jgi:hypothetical protein
MILYPQFMCFLSFVVLEYNLVPTTPPTLAPHRVRCDLALISPLFINIFSDLAQISWHSHLDAVCLPTVPQRKTLHIIEFCPDR